jgi:hypothetical protein
MPDPRLNTHRLGTEYQRRMTYKGDGADIIYDETQPGGSAVVGRAVYLSGNGIVRLTADATPVLGKLIAVEPGNFCTVQVGGNCDLPQGTGAACVAGARIVGAVLTAARGYIRRLADATLAEVAVGNHCVDDATTSTAIEVNLHG